MRGNISPWVSLGSEKTASTVPVCILSAWAAVTRECQEWLEGILSDRGMVREGLECREARIHRRACEMPDLKTPTRELR